MPRVKLTMYHMIETVWCDSDSVTCYYWMWEISV